MKLFLSLALLISAVSGMDTESCSLFQLDLQTSYNEGVAVKCSAEELNIMHNMVQAVATIDNLASGVYLDPLPAFDLAMESYQDAMIDYTGSMAEPVTEEQKQEHLTIEDELEIIKYSEGEEDGASENQRRLELFKQQVLEKKPAPKGLRGLKNQAPTKEGPQEVDMEGWTMMDGGLSGNGPRASDFAGEDDSHRRRLFDGCTTSSGCTQNWCCTFCGFNCFRRRNLQVSARTPLLELDTEEPTAAPSPAPTVTASDHPSAMPSETPTTAPTTEPEHIVFARKVAASEKRITDELTHKFRKLAIDGTCPCLGNFWQIELEFRTNLAQLKAALAEDDIVLTRGRSGGGR